MKSIMKQVAAAMKLKKKRVDPIKFLNEDCLAVLFTYLDFKSIKTASLVSR